MGQWLYFIVFVFKELNRKGDRFLLVVTKNLVCLFVFGFILFFATVNARISQHYRWNVVAKMLQKYIYFSTVMTII